MRKTILKIYSWIISAGILYCIFIKLTNFSFPCPFYKITGLRCAGCGATRMFLSLMRFDFKSAFFYNPVMLCIVFFWIVISIMLYTGKPKFVQNPRVLFTLLSITVASFIIFGFLRNF